MHRIARYVRIVAAAGLILAGLSVAALAGLFAYIGIDAVLAEPLKTQLLCLGLAIGGAMGVGVGAIGLLYLSSPRMSMEDAGASSTKLSRQLGKRPARRPSTHQTGSSAPVMGDGSRTRQSAPAKPRCA